MSRGARAIIALYTVLGLVLFALGLVAAYAINEGYISVGNGLYRIVAIVASLILAAIGFHWVIVGAASLRGG